MSKDLIHNNASSQVGISKKLDLSAVNKKSLSGALSKVELPRLFYQLVIFVLDASQSMTWEGLTGLKKGEELSTQLPHIIERLQKSKNKNCFDLSMIAFSQETNIFLPVTNVTKLELNELDLNPCNKVGNYKTYMEQALIHSENIINNYFSSHQDHSQAILLILTDGDINDYDNCIEIAERLKQNNRITISSCLFEDKKWNEYLENESLTKIRNNVKQLASLNATGESFFISKIDAEEIRKHMIKSISTVSKID
jgi:uncharacterized protein YegL